MIGVNGIAASVGFTGDSYDTAMGAASNNLYMWELIYPKSPWTGLVDVEFATMSYMV